MSEKNTESARANEPVEDAVPEYTAEELVRASKSVFSVSPDIATAALRLAGVKRTTIAEASRIIHDFANKEVR